MNEDTLKEIAKQLRCPEGEDGIKTGERMAQSNANMTLQTIGVVASEHEQKILEIGFGNGTHIATLLEKAPNSYYFGVDISDTMFNEAHLHNAPFIASGHVQLALTDGKTLPFEDSFFDKIFTVNTVYFWQNPPAYLAEIHRVLKPGGYFCLTFADKAFMEKLPIVQYGFQLYSKEDATALLAGNSFALDASFQHTESVQSNLGMMVERTFHVLKATRI
jgi:ubiquinone/menaquinone biosynthesis C-methylase UbiE